MAFTPPKRNHSDKQHSQTDPEASKSECYRQAHKSKQYCWPI